MRHGPGPESTGSAGNTPNGPKLHPELAAWLGRGRWLEVFGHRLFVVEEGPEEAEPLLILHGFPTFSFDFRKTLASLTRRFRVILHDHLGFGFSAKPAGYSYSLVDQAEMALGVWRQLGVRAGHLLAHDYGTSVATELLARRERDLLPLVLRSVTLSNGSVYLEMAKLRLSQRLLRHPKVGPRFARLVGWRFFHRRLRALCGDPQALGEDELDALWQGVAHDDGAARLVQVSAYLGERMRLARRWHEPLGRLDLPVHILWGRKDPVAVEAIARRLAQDIPGARLTWLEDLGHYPMLEGPEVWAGAVMEFLGTRSEVS